MNLETPKHYRKGQTIFNFLEWLYVEKGYKDNTESTRLADPYHISDEKLDGLYREFLEKYPID